MATKVKKIGTVESLEKIIRGSKKKPVFIFKHEETIPESQEAYTEYLSFIEDNEEDILFTFVNVREDSEVSDAIEEMLDISDSVPQLILLIDGEVAWDDKGSNIVFDNILEVVNEFVMV
ncbi:monothiol bacilliredoxin BrxC family protein [Serpentinicella alkaliphila]|uniref:Bacillithiol system protein YtxJ n=1 Tax=Serpentinicella alkaliphila TaxID=1734049 RepID=A0A4R2TEV3_9FIRM|nr:monothiol bacilliredoxin BrxC family protein [Serpentinicella alkaliphila]QUH25963.1 DUF2847 family protein [Serpentinicella alkaliphila]TCQ02070.1 bacillithiol system protein YtxJ [Serpentinicella alkaliphila]